MMNYFVIKQNTEIPVIGCIPQTRFEPKDMNSNMLIYRDNWKEMVDGKTIFDLTMENRAKLTKFTSDSALIDASSLCYNEEVHDVLKEFKIDENLRANVNLHMLKGPKLNFEYLSLLKNRREFINWKKSKFCKTRLRFHDKDLEINSLEDYNAAKETIPYNKIHTGGLLLESSNIEYDLFYIGLPVGCIFVSERLKIALEAVEPLGKDFVSADNYSVVNYKSGFKTS